MDEKPEIFWYSSLIIFTLLTLFYGIFYGPFRAIGVVFAIITVITYINNTKIAFRGMPLLPEDFQLADQAGTLTDFIDTGELVRVILAAVLSTSLGFLLDYLARPILSYFPVRKKKSKKKKLTKRARAERKKQLRIRALGELIPRMVIIPSAIFGFFLVADPIINHGGAAYQKYDWLGGAEFISWSQALNYEQNTFLLGFIYNLNRYNIEPPKDYGKNKMAEIKQKYTKLSKEESNVKKKDLKDADYNIVVILNESFYDPMLLKEVYPFNGPDPIPVFRELSKSTPTGYMYSPEYGGGTANVEFEVDTSLSNYWAQTTPYTSILPKLDRIVSIANTAKAAGYKTTAIHSYTGEMYKRSYVLPIEGFDDFITQDKMHHTERDGSSGGYINDRSIYAETLDILENSDKKQLISVLTMQDHAPYQLEAYGEETEYSFDDPNSTVDLADPISAYLQGVHYSDAYLGEFLENLKKSDEKTVVLFFGDHAPGIFSYANTSTDKELADLTHLTPYFIWANFDAGMKPTKLPTTTPNCLTNTMYDMLGLKKDVEGLIVAGACAENPILAPTYLADSQPKGKATTDYELLNYDILNGKQYWF